MFSLSSELFCCLSCTSRAGQWRCSPWTFQDPSGLSCMSSHTASMGLNGAPAPMCSTRGILQPVVKGMPENEAEVFLNRLKMLSDDLHALIFHIAPPVSLNHCFSSSLQHLRSPRSSSIRLLPSDSAWRCRAGRPLTPPCASTGFEVTSLWGVLNFWDRGARGGGGFRHLGINLQGTYLSYLLLFRWDSYPQQQPDPHLSHAQKLPAINYSLC